MNEYDKKSLFDMSYALMRRFAIIRLGLPTNYAADLKVWADAAQIAAPVTANMQDLLTAVAGERELGPAIFYAVLITLLCAAIWFWMWRQNDRLLRSRNSG